MSITQSPDRLGEIVSGYTAQEAGRDGQPPDASDAEMVFESHQQQRGQQHSSMSEGVASALAQSAGEVEEGMGEAAPHSIGATGGGGMAAARWDSSSECVGASNCPTAGEAAGGSGGGLTGHGKRKSRGSEMGEVGDNTVGGISDEAGPALRRVPSGGDARPLLLTDGGGAAGQQGPPDACDSNGGDSLPPLVGVTLVDDKPSDAEIVDWQNQIMQADTASQPFIGDREPLDVLQAEYAAGSPVFVAKIGKLRELYGSIRRSRGDGNCFYRSFFFSLLESIIAAHDETERDRIVKRLEVLKEGLTKAGYEELVFESPLDLVLQLLRSVASPVDPLMVSALEDNMRNGDIGNYVLFLLRMLTSAEIKSRADFFAPFIMGLSDMDVESFCRRCVDPMGEESDHVQLVALTDALQVPIRVAYLDRSMAPGGDGGDGGDIHVDMHDFIPEGCPSPQPRVHLLYRPGHYDILYPR